MSATLVADFADATRSLKNDASYARNIFNGATKDRPVDGLKAELCEINGQSYAVAVYDKARNLKGYLAWEWFVVKIVATAAMQQGFRVSVVPCAPGFVQASADETAASMGNPSVGFTVDYDTWLKAHNGGLNGHSKTNNPADPYTVEAWIS